MNSPRRLYTLKPLVIVVVVLGIGGGIFAEVVFRKSAALVESVADQWVKAAPFVSKLVGDVQSMEAQRSYSKGDWGLTGPKSGRKHYLVHGSKGEVDLLVYWEEVPGAAAPKLVKVQMIDARGFDTIWPGAAE